MDQHFHYYGTFIAGVMAGLPIHDAKKLAYYCYGISNQFVDTQQTQSWHFGRYTFNPIISRICATEQTLGLNNCALAFERFPAMNKQFDKWVIDDNSSMPVVKNNLKTDTLVCNRAGKTTQIQCYYNPLTDVDWQGGGDFRFHFKQRLTQMSNQKVTQQNRLKRFNNHSEIPGLNHTKACYEEPDKLNLLVPKPNSHFIHKAINDVIYKRHYNEFEYSELLALLGCRLFVSQYSWASHSYQGLVNAWLCSWQAIKCFMTQTPISDFYHQFNDTPQGERFLRSLKQTLSMPTGVNQNESIWLSLIEKGLERGALSKLNLDYDMLFYGIMLREQYLLMQAQSLSGSDKAFEISDPNRFKQCMLYKLNKAAQYHCDWLARQLAKEGLSAFNTQQSIGNLELWRSSCNFSH